MRISDWSSDVCSSDLIVDPHVLIEIRARRPAIAPAVGGGGIFPRNIAVEPRHIDFEHREIADIILVGGEPGRQVDSPVIRAADAVIDDHRVGRSEEHTSELQSLMRNSYAVFCLKKKKTHEHNYHYNNTSNTHTKYR